MPQTQMMNSAGRPSLQLGRGVNSSTGSPLGVAVIPDDPQRDPLNSGQQVSYDVSIIESTEELSNSLGVSVGAEARYGLFSASGSVDLHEKSESKTFATYVLAKCDVINPPFGLFDPGSKEAAVQIKDLPDKFRRAYGDMFVRSAITGGQFYVLLEIVHKDTQRQKSLAASIQAQYNGFLAGGSVSFALNEEDKQHLSESSFRILQYQASGQGVETNLVTDVAGAIERLKAFPKIVLDHPVSIQVELATYDTIPTLQPNLQRQAALEQALQDAARKRLSYRTVINDCSFFLEGNNRDYFENPPTDDDVKGWRTAYTLAWNAVSEHAQNLADGLASGLYVEPADLPVPRFRRLPTSVGADASVPDVRSLDIDAAQAQIRQSGFTPVASVQTVSDQDNTTPLHVVLSQNPAPQTKAPTGSVVYLGYASKQNKRWNALALSDFATVKRSISIAND